MKLAVANQNSRSLPPTVLAAGFDLLTPPMLNHIFRGEPLDEPLPEPAAAFPADCKNLFFSLHSSSPIEGNLIACAVYGQNRHEIACRGYTRAQASRRVDSWVVGPGLAITKERIAFPPFANQGAPISHLGIGAMEGNRKVLLFAVRLMQPLVFLETVELYFVPGDVVITNPGLGDWATMTSMTSMATRPVIERSVAAGQGRPVIERSVAAGQGRPVIERSGAAGQGTA